MGSGRAASTLRVIEHRGQHPGITTSRLHSAGRRSFLLEWRTAEGSFRGEASPLPGYGSDDAELAETELRSLQSDFLEHLRADRRQTSCTIEELEALSGSLRSPAARFALETVWLRTRAWDEGLPVWQLLRAALDKPLSDVPESLATSAVLDAGNAGTLERARLLLNRGVTTFKIKCGRDWLVEKTLIEAVAGLGSVHLRLDPNLAWTPSDLARAAAELSPSLPIEFIEDPTPDLKHWDTALPFAYGIDEPLGAMPVDPGLLRSAAARFVVLKPMALGGFARCLRWARAAAEIGASCVVSHLFDGPLALDAAVELAFAVQSPDHAAGLGDHLGLQAFAETPRFLVADRLIRPVCDRLS